MRVPAASTATGGRAVDFRVHYLVSAVSLPQTLVVRVGSGGRVPPPSYQAARHVEHPTAVERLLHLRGPRLVNTLLATERSRNLKGVRRST